MKLSTFALFATFAVACTKPQPTPADAASVTTHRVGANPGGAGAGTPLIAKPGHELAAFAEGCFWGSENTFRHVPGVTDTAVGYAGGTTDAPTYESVCSHTTGHAEVVLIEFDPKVVSYDKLVHVFFDSHDPTTKDRQGPDVGDQYRSAVFFFNDAQRVAYEAIAKQEAQLLGQAITTQASQMPRFWIAEDYHQQYDEKTGRESCPLPRKKPRS